MTKKSVLKTQNQKDEKPYRFKIQSSENDQYTTEIILNKKKLNYKKDHRTAWFCLLSIL